MAKPTYFEMLKDPRWQRRRLEILQTADFRCENCEADDKTLHVHHKLYRKGAKPWEYADHELQALCEECHAAEHLIREQLAEVMALMPPYDLERLLGYAQALMLFAGEPLRPIEVKSYEHAHGMSDAVSPTDPQEIYDYLLPTGPVDRPIDGLAISELYTRRRDARNKQ